MKRTMLKNHFSNTPSHWAHPYGQSQKHSYGQMQHFAPPQNFALPQNFAQPHPQDIQTLISNAVAAQHSNSSSATIMQELNRTRDGREQSRIAIRLSQNSQDSAESVTPVQNSPPEFIAAPPKKKGGKVSKKKA